MTIDGGSTWVDSGTARGSVAIGNFQEGDVLSTYAVRIVGTCDGLQLELVAEGRSPTVVACVPAEAPKKGQVALSVAPDMGWIVNGDETWVADGDLTSWKRA